MCTTCGADLKDVSVYCKDAQLYCESDYKANFVPKCAKCLEYILEVGGEFLQVNVIVEPEPMKGLFVVRITSRASFELVDSIQ